MFRMRAPLALLLFCGAATSATAANPVVVRCDRGQLLNWTLGTLNKQTPTTVKVYGTCTEYVLVHEFLGLTLMGAPGATLAQPATQPGTGLVATLMIDASRSVVIQGFAIQAATTGASGVIIRGGSNDIRLRNLTVRGGGIGVATLEHSQVSIVQLTGRDPGYAPVGVYDGSDIHLEDSLLEHSTGEAWHAGIDVGASHVTLHGVTIRNMQVGMHAGANSVIDLANYNAFVPFGGPTDVVIDNPAGTNVYGAAIQNGSSLNLGTKLVITNAGQNWGGDTGGVLVSDGGKLDAGANLEISGSHGQGIFVSNGSEARLAGSHISGGLRGGLVVVNGSNLTVDTYSASTEVSGNVVDLFCDARSSIAGGRGISGSTTVQCANLLPGPYVAVP